MAGRVRLKGFRLMYGTTDNEKNESVKSEEQLSFEGRFRATRIWNGILKRFKNGMPLKRHRRQFKIYDNSFTGTEAVDFLMKELPKYISVVKEINRSNCALLLNKFMNIGLFLSVRGFNSSFKENELYRFSDLPLEKLASTPVLVKRAASFNGRYSMERHSPKDVLKKISEKKVGDNLFSTGITIPKNPGSLARSKRLSSSHGNLSSLIKSNSRNPKEYILRKENCEETIQENESVDQRLNCRESPNCSKSQSDNRTPILSQKFSLLDDLSQNLFAEANELDEKSTSTPVSKIHESKQNAEVSGKCPVVHSDAVPMFDRHLNEAASSNSSRSFGRVLQQKNAPEVITSSPRNAEFVNPQSPLPSTSKFPDVLSEMDISRIRKDVLLARLCELLRKDSLEGIFDEQFSNDDLKWNSEQIGTTGIVRSLDGSEELSSYTISMMRYLCRWPFDKKMSDKNIIYPGLELNVFENVCDHFHKLPCALPLSIAISLLNVVRVFRSRNTLASDNENAKVDSNSESVEIAISLSTASISSGSLKNENSSKLCVSPAGGQAFLNLTEREQASSNLCGAAFSYPFGYSVSSSVSDPKDDVLDQLIERLPGLERSPELLKHVKELKDSSRERILQTKTTGECLQPPSTAMQSAHISAQTRFSALIIDVKPNEIGDLMECFALILLTMKPAFRRRLHYLLRFMQRISSNHCLRLDGNRENRFIVLERLSSCVIASSKRINSLECLHLVSFLVDNEGELFVVPKTFISAVEDRESIQREKRISVVEKEYEDENSTEKLKFQYCEQIKAMEYYKQKEEDTETHLLILLDGIEKDQNLTNEEKRKQLKKFKKIYPKIYEKRFPSPKLAGSKKSRTPSILRKFRTFSTQR